MIRHKNNKRILHGNLNIVILIPCLSIGGSELATLQMIQALKNDYNIRVICFYEYSDAMVDKYRRASITVELLQRQRGGVKELFNLLKYLISRLKHLKPDIVHVQYLAPGMIPVLAAKMARVKNIFATVHAAGGSGYKLKSKLMLRFSAIWVNHFFCVSKNTEKFWFGKNCSLISNKRYKHSAIYNAVDIERFSKVPKANLFQIKKEDVVIGAVGRLVKLKGYDCLLKAVSIIDTEYDNYKLMIVGDGKDAVMLKEFGNDLGIADKIIWVDNVEHEELPGYYKLMDLFVMPSLVEGFGLSAAEAMAAGCPVIATKVPGLIEVVGENENCGFLFEINDFQQLAKHLELLMKNTALRVKLGNAAMQRVRSLFSIAGQRKAWKEAYKLLTNQTKRE